MAHIIQIYSDENKYLHCVLKLVLFWTEKANIQLCYQICEPASLLIETAQGSDQVIIISGRQDGSKESRPVPFSNNNLKVLERAAR